MWILLVLLLIASASASPVGIDGSSPSGATTWGFGFTYTGISVSPGTPIDFIWSSLHGVLQVNATNYASCNATGAVTLAAAASSGTYAFNTTGLSIGTVLYFFCPVSGHCGSGVKQTVTIIAAPTPAPTTLAPTTKAPTSLAPTTLAPTTLAPTTLAPTLAPTTGAPSTSPTYTPGLSGGAKSGIAIGVVFGTFFLLGVWAKFGGRGPRDTKFSHL